LEKWSKIQERLFSYEKINAAISVSYCIFEMQQNRLFLQLEGGAQSVLLKIENQKKWVSQDDSYAKDECVLIKLTK